MAQLLPGIQPRDISTSRLRMRVLTAQRARSASPDADTGDHGDNAVLFVHGNVSSSLFFQETLLALPAGLQGFAPDLRGFGETEPLPLDATRGLRDFSDDLAALIDALGLGRVHLAGWSMGGGVILQYLLDHADRVRSLTLLDPVSPYGFGATKGADGQLVAPDGAGSGGGSANPEFVRRLREGDRGADDPNSPRNVMNAFYFKPPFRSALEEIFVDSMLSTRIGEDFYPGDSRPSEHWPGIAPGTRGILNTMAPTYLNLRGITEVTPKPPILWIRGADDLIVSDRSMLDFATLGQLGYVPGWPGEEVCPPQPMVTQMRTLLDAYQAQGGRYWEVVIPDAGHSPHIEQPERFREALFRHLQLAP